MPSAHGESSQDVLNLAESVLSLGFGPETGSVRRRQPERISLAPPPPPSKEALMAIAIPDMSESRTQRSVVGMARQYSTPHYSNLGRRASKESKVSLPSSVRTSFTSHSEQESVVLSFHGQSLRQLHHQRSLSTDTRARSVRITNSEQISPARPTVSSIHAAGFLESSPDPTVTLRHLLSQPNTMYGILRREKLQKSFFTGSTKSIWNSYVVALHNDTLHLFHANRNLISRNTLTTTSSINGPFYSLGSSNAFWDKTEGSDTTTSPPATSSTASSLCTSSPSSPTHTQSASTDSSHPHASLIFSSSSLYQPPSYSLQLTPASEIHVSESGVYVLRVTGRKAATDLLQPRGTTSVLAHSGGVNSAAAIGFDFLEDKVWMLQFDGPESMMEWMTRVRRVISVMKTRNNEGDCPEE